MNRTLIVAAVMAVAGFGCQRTYEDRSEGYTSERELKRAARTESAQLEYGEEGQQQDVNLNQDLADDEEEAIGGSGTAGMEADELGYGGGGDAGTMKHDMMKHDAGLGSHMGMGMATDAGTTLDAGTMLKKKAMKK